MMKLSHEEQSNNSNVLLNDVPSVNELLKPFEPYIKRFGFMYVHFKNGTGLTAKEFREVIKEIYDKSKIDYCKNVDEWCQRRCI